jgi:hypothetical protein
MTLLYIFNLLCQVRLRKLSGCAYLIRCVDRCTARLSFPCVAPAAAVPSTHKTAEKVKVNKEAWLSASLSNNPTSYPSVSKAAPNTSTTINVSLRGHATTQDNLSALRQPTVSLQPVSLAPTPPVSPMEKGNTVLAWSEN